MRTETATIRSYCAIDAQLRWTFRFDFVFVDEELKVTDRNLSRTWQRLSRYSSESPSTTRTTSRREVVTVWIAQSGYRRMLGWSEVGNHLPKLTMYLQHRKADLQALWAEVRSGLALAVCGHLRGTHLIAPRLCQGMSPVRM